MKAYNKQWFCVPASEDGVKSIIFVCWTTRTKCGFCHSVAITDERNICKEYTTTKTSYYNRTWESYDYETTIKRAARKAGKDIYNKVCAGEIKRTY